MALKTHLTTIKGGVQGILQDAATRKNQILALERVRRGVSEIMAGLKEQQRRSQRDNAQLAAEITGIVDSLDGLEE